MDSGEGGSLTGVGTHPLGSHQELGVGRSWGFHDPDVGMLEVISVWGL